MPTLPRLALLGATLCTAALLAGPAAAQSNFVRGDANADGGIDIGDQIFLLSALFSGGPSPTCLDAGDANDDGAFDIGDPVYGLGFLFSSGPPPAPPHPDCGADATADALGCASFPLCGAVEICDNNVDDDGDGFIDCADFDCAGDPACPEICDNNVDDDGDGFIDCDDLDCAGDPACPEICDNNVDDDGDGFIDCDDLDCAGDPACGEICDNGIDDDNDGFVDCQDFDCAADPACAPSHATDIQPIWDANCTVCHSGPNPFAGLSLESGLAYGNIVGVASTECSTLDFIDPFSPATSWLFRKVEGTHTASDITSLGCTSPGTGNQMPPGTFCCITPAELQLIEQWILGGALP